MVIEHKTYGCSFHVKRDENGLLVFFRDGNEVLAKDLHTSEIYLIKDFLRLEKEDGS